MGFIFIYLFLNLFRSLLWLLGEESRDSGMEGIAGDLEAVVEVMGSRPIQNIVRCQANRTLCWVAHGCEKKGGVKEGSWLFGPNSRVKGPFAEMRISARDVGASIHSASLLVKLGVRHPGRD